MGFDTRRYIKDYCRNPAKTQAAAMRGEYAHRIVTVRRGDMIHYGRFDRANPAFDEWLASPQTRLSFEARRAALEIIRRGSADVKSPVENELTLSLRRFAANRRN